MKQCLCCKETKEFSAFSKHKQKADGYYSYCKECKKIKDKLSYEKHKEARYASSVEWKNKNKEKVKEYKKTWNRKNKGYFVAWLEENKEHVKTEKRKWKKNNKGYVNSCTRARQAAKLSRTPQWADQERIKAYYDVCAFFNEVNGYIKYHVDHEIPLQGKTVSGLHVHNNLQVILAKDNMEKGNKYGKV